MTHFLGAGTWLAEDDDPNFILSPPDGPIIAGFYELTINASAKARSETTPITPKLYFDVGGGFTEATALQLPLVADRHTCLVRLPPGIRNLRIDPISQPGRFTLHDVSMRRLGRMELAKMVSRQLGRRWPDLSTLLSGDLDPMLNLTSLNHVVAEHRAYAAWLTRYEPSGASYEGRVRSYLSAMPHRPTISVVMPVYNTDLRWLHEAIISVKAQVYGEWELCIVDDASTGMDQFNLLTSLAAEDDRIRIQRLENNGGISAATNAALDMASGEWVAFMDHDDLLRPDALALLAAAIIADDNARIIYTDEDQIDENGVRSNPYMKGDWNRELFYAQNYLNHFTTIRRDIIDAAGGLRSEFDGSQDYDLYLRSIEQIDDAQIVHLPFVCYHWRFATNRVNFSQTQGSRSVDAGIAALNDHFDRIEAPARAERVSADLPYARARWTPAARPFVSLIIPTRDRRPILEVAVSSIREKTSYPDYEILIIDNDSRDRETLDYFTELKASGAARIIPAPGPFNFSRINNIAARHAEGDILGFINNDIEVRNAEWLDEMVSHFAREDVGAVGAKLYYPDGSIQHAGVTTGIGGVAGHLYKRFAGDAPGPFSLLQLPREVSCVTAACMLMRASLFETLGGFNEDRLAVAFNDVDLCLRARQAGARIIWTPFAELDHHESLSRGSDEDADKRARFRAECDTMLELWGKETLAQDAYYSPNLTLDNETGGIAAPPRARRPWD